MMHTNRSSKSMHAYNVKLQHGNCIKTMFSFQVNGDNSWATGAMNLKLSVKKIINTFTYLM
jgi:hypothetical protein